MQVGDEIHISRLGSGLYKIHQINGKGDFVGAAASTVLTLSHLVFRTEAAEETRRHESWE